jgi:hypothetical protein
MGGPTETHALSNLKPFSFFAEAGNRTDNFMTGNKGVLGQAPLVVEHRKVGVADTTV